MRYEDWDILLFPAHCEVPVKEFKVACHVVSDPGMLPSSEYLPAGHYRTPKFLSCTPQNPPTAMARLACRTCRASFLASRLEPLSAYPSTLGPSLLSANSLDRIQSTWTRSSSKRESS